MPKNLIYYLEKIPDFRNARGRRHQLPVVLLITILAIMSGELGYQAMSRFLERHRRNLSRLLGLPISRVPSASVIRRVLIGLNYKEVEKQLNKWLKENAKVPQGEWVSGDGKALKNTVCNYDEAQQEFFNFVSFFSHQKGIVMGVKVMNNKEISEIHALENLLDILDIKGVTFSLDALHCQKKTLDKIVDKGNNYLVKVKNNQKNLFKAIENQCRTQEPLKVYQEKDRTRGREVHRRVEVFSLPVEIDPKWQSANCVIKVTRQGRREGYDFERTGYYLTSHYPNCRHLALGIRGHWTIENRLHWVKDVIQNEDRSPQKKGLSPINISLLKTWVLTLYRLEGYDSLTKGIDHNKHNIRQLLSLCR